MTKLQNGTPEEAGFLPERIERLRARAPEWVDGERMRSGVLLAAQRGKIAFHEAYGPLTHEPNSPPLQLDSIFPIASITKPITATCIMMLVEDGIIGLNRPITEYLPEVSGEGTDEIEVQHLLTHTSGFDWDDEEETFATRISQQELLPGLPEEGLHSYNASQLNVLWELKSHFAPGSHMSYCNHNYNLLGEIVRRVSGRSLNDFATERIFDPLDMIDTSYLSDETKWDRRVMRRNGVHGGGIEGDPMSGLDGLWYSHGTWASGGGKSTALDLAKFAQVFLDGGKFVHEGEERRLLSPATVYEMSRDQLPGIKTDFFKRDFEASWGLGWMVQGNDRWPWYSGTLAPKGTFYHGGAGGSMLWIDRANEIVGIYLTVCHIFDEEKKRSNSISISFRTWSQQRSLTNSPTGLLSGFHPTRKLEA